MGKHRVYADGALTSKLDCGSKVLSIYAEPEKSPNGAE